jgi:hypothetical protein
MIVATAGVIRIMIDIYVAGIIPITTVMVDIMATMIDIRITGGYPGIIHT